jgi:eukaryotic-like serine/threonine-protein kinase
VTLKTGTRLGAYEITGSLGAGGMGEVYRAKDTKLGREVAIKTLPAALAGDEDRLARFEREAKLLAALNHAHIAQVYGLDEHDGTQYLAMELVEGETLEQRLKKGPLPVDDALRFGLQIAEALEAAHEKGVVHRDLKPANVMVTRDGVVKVLDFGLAKAFAGDPEAASPLHSPALSVAMTQQGLILGTAGYMSPEQASGQATDQRADVWAFGVVLYEMLSGMPLFSGESVPHILAAVLQTEPNWNRLPKSLPPRLKLLLERCLAKKPRNRLHSIADARIDIESVLSDPQSAAASAVAAPSSRRALPLAVGLVLGIVIAGVGAWLVGSRSGPAAAPRLVSRFDWNFPEGQVFRDTQTPIVAFSRDGRQIVYAMADGLYVRAMNELVPRRIPGTENEDASNPFFSPDGQTIAFWADGRLKRIALGGGAPVAIADALFVWGASWGSDGTIVFGAVDGIYRIPAVGGKPERVIPIQAPEVVFGPEMLPDGDAVLFTVMKDVASWDNAQIVAESLSTHKRTVLVDGGSDARYAAPDRLVYALRDQLFAIAFDPGTLSVSGVPALIGQGVMRARFGSTGTANYGVSADGTLVYVRGGDVSAGLRNTFVWVDRDGREEPLGLDPCACVSPVVSPDGTRVAFQMLAQNLRDADLWVWTLEQHTLTRLTFEAGLQDGSAWTPDSERIAFRSSGGILVRHADGTGAAEAARSVTYGTPWAWTHDGDLIFTDGGSAAERFGVLPAGGDREPRFILPNRGKLWSAALSPDGRWLAYQSDETGRPEIYVRPFPNVEGGTWQISSGGGTEPKWTRDGRTLVFLGPKALMSTTVDTAASFSFSRPAAVLDRSPYLFVDGPPTSYDLSPEGQRFLLVKPAPAAADAAVVERPRIVIVQNWRQALDTGVAGQ